MTRHNREGGFAWTDLLAVVLVLGILAAVAIPIYISIDRQAREYKTVQADVLATKQSLKTALAQDKTIHSGSTFEVVGAPVHNSQLPDEKITVLIESEHEILILGKLGDNSLSYSQTLKH